MPPKEDPEVTALKKEVNDIIAKFQVREKEYDYIGTKLTIRLRLKFGRKIRRSKPIVLWRRNVPNWAIRSKSS